MVLVNLNGLNLRSLRAIILMVDIDAGIKFAAFLSESLRSSRNRFLIDFIKSSVLSVRFFGNNLFATNRTGIYIIFVDV